MHYYIKLLFWPVVSLFWCAAAAAAGTGMMILHYSTATSRPRTTGLECWFKCFLTTCLLNFDRMHTRKLHRPLRSGNASDLCTLVGSGRSHIIIIIYCCSRRGPPPPHNKIVYTTTHTHLTTNVLYNVYNICSKACELVLVVGMRESVRWRRVKIYFCREGGGYSQVTFVLNKNKLCCEIIRKYFFFHHFIPCIMLFAY